MSRYAKPKALKEITGEVGRGINEHEPEYKPASLKAPPHLTAVAKKEWNRIVPILDSNRLATEADVALLCSYCECWSQFVQAQKDIKKYGLIIHVKNAEGLVLNSKKNPALTVSIEAQRELRAIAMVFGFSPASRSKVVSPVTEESNNELLHLLKNRAKKKESTAPTHELVQ